MWDHIHVKMTDEERDLLVQALLKSDVRLRRKQDIWEHPRNIAILIGATAALAGGIGFKLGQTPPPPPVIIQLPAK
jgi:hypothetical protein